MTARGDNRSNMFFWPTPDVPMVERGEGIYIWDAEGRRYIDASSGPQTSNIGHGNKRVAAAVAEQLAKIAYAFPHHFKNERDGMCIVGGKLRI